MDNKVSPAFFLGANTPKGFYSLYQDFTDHSADRLFILKGGPGCGKSTFMRAVGAACAGAGQDVRYIRCSGDPDSLDGVYIPGLNVGYVDGTSPHVIEPVFAGSQAAYVNIGAFYDLTQLSARREEIARLTLEYKSHYARAFRLLAGAAALSEPPALPEACRAAAAKRAEGIIRRELRGAVPQGRARRAFLSGYTCLGPMTLWETVPAMAHRVLVLDNELGLGGYVVELVEKAAAERGLEVIICKSPMFPERTEHLIFPSLGLAIVTSTPQSPYVGPSGRRMHLDAIPGREAAAGLKSDLRRRSRLSRAIIDEATEALRDAKSSHDRLEEQYIPAVDFAGVDRLTQRHIEALLS